MKKVIFICLLAVSVCLSQSANTGNPPPQPHDPAKPLATDAAATTPPTVTQPTPSTTVDPKVNDTAHKTNETDPKTISTTVVPTTDKNNKTDTNNNTADDKTTTTTTPKPTTTTNSTTVAPVTPKNDTTVKPAATTATPTLQARGFDGASFVGGIILTLGLLAIGFMGFKYYKAQTERNYHTL